MPKHTTFEELFKDRYTDKDPDFKKQKLFDPPICMMLGGEGGRLMPSQPAQSSQPAQQQTKISREEAELYDRQIRLWGLEAQNRLRNSTVLIVGLSGLGAEVAKNLMLCGLKSMTLMDEKKVTPDDYLSQFLLELNSVGVNRAEASKAKTQALNPMVELSVLPEPVSSKPREFFDGFNVVILIDQKYDDIVRVDNICRFYNVKFQAGGVYGWTGFAFFDFNNHTFLVPKPKQQQVPTELSSDEEGADADQTTTSGDSGEPATKKLRKNGDTIKVKKVKCSAAKDHQPAVTIDDDEEDAKVPAKVKFPSFASAMGTDFSSKRMLRVSRSALLPSAYFPIRALLSTKFENVDESTLQAEMERVVASAKAENMAAQPSSEELKFYLGPQLSPVCAIVGSIIGQEAIKAISQSEVPLQNFFTYSALDTAGIVCKLPLTS